MVANWWKLHHLVSNTVSANGCLTSYQRFILLFDGGLLRLYGDPCGSKVDVFLSLALTKRDTGIFWMHRLLSECDACFPWFVECCSVCPDFFKFVLVRERNNGRVNLFAVFYMHIDH